MKFRKKPEYVEAVTFEELVAHGLAQPGASIVNGVPWSFTYKGHPVTHENDTTYLIAGTKFSHNQVIVEMDGKLVAFWAIDWHASHECCDFNAQTPVAQTKSVRLAVKELVESLNGAARKSRSRSLAITKLEEASMWLGKDLQELNEPNPYPNSHNPANPVIDAPAPEACKLATA